MGGVGSGAKPREYPPSIVKFVCDMYDSGATVAEIPTPKGYRVQTILERFYGPRRRAAKRNQSGSSNHMWKGDEAGYCALHLRVEAQRGKPSLCETCGTTEGRFEWANLSGEYADINDYARLCVSCHRRLDARRRKESGRRTSPERR